MIDFKIFLSDLLVHPLQEHFKKDNVHVLTSNYAEYIDRKLPKNETYLSVETRIDIGKSSRAISELTTLFRGATRTDAPEQLRDVFHDVIRLGQTRLHVTTEVVAVGVTYNSKEVVAHYRFRFEQKKRLFGRKVVLYLNFRGYKKPVSINC